MFVKPGHNPETDAPFRVRIPGTWAFIPVEGCEVADNFFWRWMLRHGDVVAAEPAKVEPVADTPQKPAAEA